MTIAAETDPAADFDGFYGAHFRGIVILVYGYTGDMAAAQDIAQEAFCRVWQRWQRVSRYDDPIAWVRRVAYHLAHSRWRRLKVAATYVMKQRLEEVAPLDPDHVAVVAALRKLPPAQREAIVLHHMMDLPVNEVAEYLEVPVGTVKSWLHRGRAALAVDLAIDAREGIVAPPAEEIMADAKRRRRRAAIATAVIVMLVAGLLVAIQLIRPQRNPHPVTPSPTVDNSSLRSVGWPASTIHFDIAPPGCPTGPTVFDTPHVWPRALLSNASGVAFGDLTGDGDDEAVLSVSCQESADSTPATGLLMVVRRQGGELHVLGWLGKAQSDFWIDAGSVYADVGRRVNGWRWNGDSFSSVDTSVRYPEYEPGDDAHWLVLDRLNRPYLVTIQVKEKEISLVVLDRVEGEWQIVSTAAVKGPGPARIVGRVADPSVTVTGRKDMRLTVIEVSTPDGTQLFRWRNAQLTAVVAH